MPITMFDSVTPSAIPSGAQAVAGYVGGSWPSYSGIVARFPNARHKSIAVNSSEDADILDVERGDASPGEAPSWIQRQHARGHKFPGVYANASTMPAVQAALGGANIARSTYVLWVAAWDGSATVIPGFEAHQYIDHGPHGENYDISACADAFWHTTSPPPVVNLTHYEWFELGPFPSKWGNLNERKVVEQYDGARAHPLVYAAYLRFVLRPKLQFLADRVAHEAISQPVNGKPSWGVAHRGWRFQQLIHRAQDQRFV